MGLAGGSDRSMAGYMRGSGGGGRSMAASDIFMMRVMISENT